MLIGSHISIAGGVDKAFRRGEELGLQAMQIFTKNNNQWVGKPLEEGEIERFHTERERTGIHPVFAHDCYLINLAAIDPVNLQRSREALLDELKRCDLLAIPYLVTHPGSHLGAGESVGIQRIAESINTVFAADTEGKTMLLLEVTAGQGTNLGYRFEHLAEIRSLVENQKRVGYCIDTCHAFAAGYDLSTLPEIKKTFKQMDSILGLEHVHAFHFNDSKRELGSRVDRHEHIGKGHLGLAVFEYLMNEKKFRNHPMALETPKSPDYHEDRENIAVLKSLMKKK